MPRIVPSQVVRFIDKVLPQGGGNPTLGRGNAGQLRALVTLVDGIPDELLTMDSDSYAGLACGVANIKETLATWVGDRSARGNLDPVPGFGSETAVTLIRKALVKCSDEAPSPATAELKFISDPKLKENLRIDIGAVYRALSNGEWKAATVLAGAAIEALLLWHYSNRSLLNLQKPHRLPQSCRANHWMSGIFLTTLKQPTDSVSLPTIRRHRQDLRKISGISSIQVALNGSRKSATRGRRTLPSPL